VDIDWDSGSTLSMLLDSGDRIESLPNPDTRGAPGALGPETQKGAPAGTWIPGPGRGGVLLRITE
jgi:hypothetical protein